MRLLVVIRYRARQKTQCVQTQCVHPLIPPRPTRDAQFLSAARTIATHFRVPRKTSYASFSRYPAGFVYWGRGLTINGLRYSGSCPFPQTPIPLRFFDVPFKPIVLITVASSDLMRRQTT